MPGQTVARSRATPPKASTTLACGRSSPGPVGGHHRIDPNTAAPSTTDLAAVTAEGAALRTAGLAHLDLDIGRDVNIDRDGQRIGAQR